MKQDNLLLPFLGALGRGNVLAALVLYMPAKYLLSDKSIYEQFIWIPIVHGFTYPVYLLAALILCIAKRKSLLSTGLFLLAGTLPVASIWIERRVKSGRW